jgi:hypothetical protein
MGNVPAAAATAAHNKQHGVEQTIKKRRKKIGMVKRKSWTIMLKREGGYGQNNPAQPRRNNGQTASSWRQYTREMKRVKEKKGTCQWLSCYLVDYIDADTRGSQSLLLGSCVMRVNGFLFFLPLLWLYTV